MKKAEVLWGFGLFAWGLIAPQAEHTSVKTP